MAEIPGIRVTGGEFFLFNTHFDHEVQFAREQSNPWCAMGRGTGNQTAYSSHQGFQRRCGANKAYDILTNASFSRTSGNHAHERRNEKVASFSDFKPSLHDAPGSTGFSPGARWRKIAPGNRDPFLPDDQFPATTSPDTVKPPLRR